MEYDTLYASNEREVAYTGGAQYQNPGGAQYQNPGAAQYQNYNLLSQVRDTHTLQLEQSILEEGYFNYLFSSKLLNTEAWLQKE